MFKYPVTYHGVEYGAEINYVNLKEGIHIEIFKKYQDEFIKVFDDYCGSSWDREIEDLYVCLTINCIQRYETSAIAEIDKRNKKFLEWDGKIQ
jgi:hypothetical protein